MVVGTGVSLVLNVDVCGKVIGATVKMTAKDLQR